MAAVYPNKARANLWDAYDLLRISPGASVEEIKAAYRKRVKKCHPDVSKSTEAEAAFRVLTDAFKQLVSAAGKDRRGRHVPTTEKGQTGFAQNTPEHHQKSRLRPLRRRRRLWRLGYAAVGFAMATGLYVVLPPLPTESPSPMAVVSEGLTLFSGPGEDYPVIAQLEPIDDTQSNTDGYYGYVAVPAAGDTRFVPLQLIVGDAPKTPPPPVRKVEAEAPLSPSEKTDTTAQVAEAPTPSIPAQDLPLPQGVAEKAVTESTNTATPESPAPQATPSPATPDTKPAAAHEVTGSAANGPLPEPPTTTHTKSHSDTARPLPKPSPQAEATASTAPEAVPPTPAFALQFGAFSKQQGAERVAASLKKRNPHIFITRTQSSGKIIWRVRAGAYASKKTARAEQKALSVDGIQSIIVTQTSP